jgi:hypothetical protein
VTHRRSVRGRWRRPGKGGRQRDAGLLKRLSGNPDVEKARVEFERAQKVEERFHKDFDRLGFTSPLTKCDLTARLRQKTSKCS